MIRHIFFTLCIFISLIIPAMIVSIPVVAILLGSGWNGRTTIFGNAKWGKGELNPSWMKSGFWAAFIWLMWRNPVDNLCARVLALRLRNYTHSGDAAVGDKIAGGFYAIKMGWAWEYYWVKPYTVFGSRRCVRVRLGWKIYQAAAEYFCPYVCAFNPWKPYSGL